MLRGIDFDINRNRVVTVINDSNSNGDALLRLLNKLSAPASNSIVFGNRPVDGLSSTTGTRLHGRGLNFVCRFRRLLPSFATLRGITVPLLVNGGGPTRVGDHTLRVLGTIKLSRHTGRHPSRLSNNRHRHITVTHTLIGGPHLMLTSRPANGLSTHGTSDVFRLLKRLGHLRNATFLIIARSLRLTGHVDHRLRVHSNHLATRLDLVKTRW